MFLPSNRLHEVSIHFLDKYFFIKPNIKECDAGRENHHVKPVSQTFMTDNPYSYPARKYLTIFYHSSSEFSSANIFPENLFHVAKY